jgi:hypothetical protein
MLHSSNVFTSFNKCWSQQKKLSSLQIIKECISVEWTGGPAGPMP